MGAFLGRFEYFYYLCMLILHLHLLIFGEEAQRQRITKKTCFEVHKRKNNHFWKLKKAKKQPTSFLYFVMSGNVKSQIPFKTRLSAFISLPPACLWLLFTISSNLLLIAQQLVTTSPKRSLNCCLSHVKWHGTLRHS